jgi:aspartate/methionine/tyrosine aminotransferase
MKIHSFKLERYFAKYEFSAKYLLSSSDCEALTQQEVLTLADEETKSLWNNLKLSYTESQGLPLLREEISNLYQNVSIEDILVVAPEEGIFIVMNSVLNKGDHVICTYPGYQSLYEIARAIGCEVTKWLPEEEKGWRFDPNFLIDNMKPNTKLIVCNFPHNPTGFLPPNNDFKRIINIAKEHDVHLFSDEMYRFLEYDPSHRLPSASDKYDKGISLFGMSKTFGMPGVRLGWVVTKDQELYKQMNEWKDYTTICTSAPSEILSLMALRAKEKIISKQLSLLQRNLKILDEFFKSYSNVFTCISPKAGSICFPRLHLEQGAHNFCQKVIQEKGIMLLPSTVYDYDDQHIRIGFGRQNMPEILKILEKYLLNL